ncbi:ArsR/SmtB family transcription factor [Rubrimonas cliftonensis]|uniref:Transcriptional regulator, ArsR family n=1 Tax=Rubrimonas cliftonensis TaxID=89524 RepID=A0A1H4DHP7_9RHOB|nr:metalloregulator ArsR/SmtB family transcription factor [Rubrimonas cliftonensis]SEA71762.1 transcriptional regulator, ArsR family [Rubrimonas cliftonensis]
MAPLDPTDDEKAELARLMDIARDASEFLKVFAHEGRFLILCHLAGGERSVTELERLISQRQAAVSQQLARLRLEGIVEARRDGKAIYYRLADERALRLIDMVLRLYGAEGAEAAATTLDASVAKRR